MTQRLRIAITSGEPSGIGPDIILMLASRSYWACDLIIIGDTQVLAQRTKRLNLNIRLRPYAPHEQDSRLCQQNEVFVEHIECPNKVKPGHLDAGNAEYVLKTLDRAIAGCQSGEFAAMVTAPLHKGIINDAGINFTGHTEYLAEKLNVDAPVMMLANNDFRVALATTHLPLQAVPEHITYQNLYRVIQILHTDLQNKYQIEHPHILICGLNPHAGEGGHMGREEIDIIIPVIRDLQQQGMHLSGPLPADTLFTPKHLEPADAVLAMYHDQGLPVLKYAGFGQAINITLGLPIIRTSVDHGTALDLAGTGQASADSLQAAIQAAIGMGKKARP